MDIGREHAFSDLNYLQKFLEKETGRETVIKGLGKVSSSVAELGPSSSNNQDNNLSNSDETSQVVRGIVRLSQLLGNVCFVDAHLDGLRGGKDGSTALSLAVHEFGDLSGPNFNSIGSKLIELDKRTNDFVDNNSATSSPNDKLVMSVRKTVANCEVLKLIGRSIALTDESSGSSEVLCAGIIARASTIGANDKQICSCSGKTIWQERSERMETSNK